MRSGGWIIFGCDDDNLISVDHPFFCTRQFHVTVVENRNDNIEQSAWMFPLYLVLINLFVAPIVLATDLIFPAGTIDRDMAVLALPLKAGSELLLRYLRLLAASRPQRPW